MSLPSKEEVWQEFIRMLEKNVKPRMKEGDFEYQHWETINEGLREILGERR